MKYFANTPTRVTHRIDQSPSPRSIPKTGDRKPAANRPAPLTGLHGRCASCGGKRR